MSVSLSGCSRYLDLNPKKNKGTLCYSVWHRETYLGGAKGGRDVALPKKLGEGRKARHDANEETGGVKPELAIVRVSNRAKMGFKSTQHLPGGSRWPGCEGLLSGL